MLRLVGLLSAFLICAKLSLAQTALRLPDDIRPTGYQAALDITPGKDSFNGHIQIELQVVKPTPVITLHAKELHIVSVNPKPREIRSGENDLLTFAYDAPLPEGTPRLTVEYTGTISRVLTDGAFQQQHSGDWYVFTKFEPITARRVFPCFDEPVFKVPWQLSLKVPSDLKAFSNTAQDAEEPVSNGYKLVRFHLTKPLPSYLVAFAVGPFDVLPTAPVGRNHVPSRIAVPKGRSAEAEYAVSITPQLIQMLETYFDTPYPYEKLDQVVVPLTTAWGAMENAGLIAYGDFFLAPKAQDSDQRRRQLAVTMEHEMSHQWFGDLVTMRWWDDLWLNEAFASWLSNKLVAAWHPEWDIQERIAAAGDVFRADSLASARKIRQPIEAAGDIGTAFDGITYGKGLAVIGMFEHYIGDRAFERGVQNYLAAHAYANATSSDLLSALDAVSPGSGVGAAFGSYLNRTGFPLVQVTVDCGQSPQVRLVQQRMVAKGSSANEDSIWNVPVCLTWEGGSRCVLLKSAAQTFSPRDLGMKAHGCPGWVFADAGAAGYYAVAYDHDNAAKLRERGVALLSRTEKAAFLRNVGLLFSSGLGDMEQELETAAAFSRQTDSNLVRQSALILAGSDEIASGELALAYQQKIRELYRSKAIALTWHPQPNDTPAIRSLRNQLLPLVAVDGNDQELSTQARQLAEDWLRDRASLEAEVVPGVMMAAAAHAGRDFLNELSAALKTTAIQRERSWIITGMAAFRDPDIAQSALALIGDSKVDARETSRLIFSANAVTRQTVWNYVQANYDRLNSMLPSARGVPFSARLPMAAAGFCNAGHADAVKAFFEEKLRATPGGQRNLAQAIESIRLCAAQAEVARPALSAFLRR